MDKKEFEMFTEEMMPLVEKMIDMAKKYNPENKMISVVCSADGYFDINNHKFKGSACRITSGGKVNISEWKDGKDVSV